MAAGAPIVPPRSRHSKRSPTPARSSGNDDAIRLGGKVRRLADNRLFLRSAVADKIADDHQPGSDTDTRLKLDRPDIKAPDSVDRTKPRPHRPLGVVFVRLRVAEID